MFLGEQATVPVGLNADTLELPDAPAFAALTMATATARPTRKVESYILTSAYGGEVIGSGPWRHAR
jgi:hypothetical protein